MPVGPKTLRFSKLVSEGSRCSSSSTNIRHSSFIPPDTVRPVNGPACAIPLGIANKSSWPVFETTVLLFQFEYAVPLLLSELAAIIATAFELACPVLLVLGLGTRLAALPLIDMTIVIDFTYQHHVEHLYWLMMLGLIVLFGPGPLSVDRFISKLLDRLGYPVQAWSAACVLEAWGRLEQIKTKIGRNRP